jgi:hypothetical protein
MRKGEKGEGPGAGNPRIRTSDLWIRIQEAQKLADPADPDPQHWGLVCTGISNTFVPTHRPLRYFQYQH